MTEVYKKEVAVQMGFSLNSRLGSVVRTLGIVSTPEAQHRYAARSPIIVIPGDLLDNRSIKEAVYGKILPPEWTKRGGRIGIEKIGLHTPNSSVNPPDKFVFDCTLDEESTDMLSNIVANPSEKSLRMMVNRGNLPQPLLAHGRLSQHIEYINDVFAKSNARHQFNGQPSIREIGRRVVTVSKINSYSINK